MQEPDFQEILRARTRIRDHVYQTQLRFFSHLQEVIGWQSPVLIKTESLQKTGSFKVRGGINKILKLCEAGKKPEKVVAASAGNHAQAVAYISRELGIPATIVMPEGAPLIKVASTSAMGAEVILHGAHYAEAYTKACEIQKLHNAVYIHAFEDPDVISGQGTIGLELHQQLNDLGIEDEEVQIVVPIGGGGLISGVSLAIKTLRPKSRVFGVVSEAMAGMAESFQQKKIVHKVSAHKSHTIADGLAVKTVSEFTFGMIQKRVEEVAVTSDSEISEAIAMLMERAKLVVEGAGAAGVGAVLGERFSTLRKDRPIVFVLCGGNIDMNCVTQIIEQGMAREKRWLHLRVLIDDRPGELAKVARIIGEHRGNVLWLRHERSSNNCGIGQTDLNFRIETKGLVHALEIQKGLEDNGYQVGVDPR